MSAMGGKNKTDRATGTRGEAKGGGAAYSPGLEGVIAGETVLCQIDEGESGLRYRGYAIGDLAEQATFEEVSYLLLLGKLPTRKELEDFSGQLRAQWVLPGPVEAFLGVVPPNAHPMDILRTGVSLLGMTDPDATGEGRVSARPRARSMEGPTKRSHPCCWRSKAETGPSSGCGRRWRRNAG